jgi:hypothetical protein
MKVSQLLLWQGNFVYGSAKAIPSASRQGHFIRMGCERALPTRAVSIKLEWAAGRRAEPVSSRCPDYLHFFVLN